MPRNQDRRIAEITGQVGEWFVYLKPGFQLYGAHCFGEDARGDIRRTMKSVAVCTCVECKILTAQAVA